MYPGRPGEIASWAVARGQQGKKALSAARTARETLGVLTIATIVCVQGTLGSGAVASPRRPSYRDWSETTFGALLAPSGADWVGPSGGIDLVVQFHGARLVEREWRAVAGGSVVVDADLGGTSSAFADALSPPGRFDEIIDEVVRSLEGRMGRGDLHARRVAVVAWSAGYAAVERVLANETDLARIDAVILLDGLHAPYVDPVPPGSSEHGAVFRHLVDEAPLAPFIRFAAAATRGEKLLVVTHSSIDAPDYASTTETAFAVAHAVDARVTEASGRAPSGMWRSDASDARDFHVRGFWGASPSDHVEHLHLVDDVVAEFLAPRWRERSEAAASAPAGR